MLYFEDLTVVYFDLIVDSTSPQLQLKAPD